MDVKMTVLIAAGLLLFSCGSDPVPVKMEQPESTVPLTATEAQNIFILHCESCHGIDGKKKASDAADLSVSKLSDEQIRQVILNGNEKGMMPYKDIIKAERDRKGLVEFVKSLREQKKK